MTPGSAPIDESLVDAGGIESAASTAIDLLNGYAHIFLIAFLVALLTTPIIRRIAIAGNVIDHPDEQRKRHAYPVAYLGGVAIFLGLIAAIAVSYVFHSSVTAAFQPIPIAVVIGMIAITFTGLADDVWGWDPRLKIAGQLVAAAALAIEDVGVRVAEGLLTPLVGNAEQVIVTIGAVSIDNGDVFYWLGTAIIAVFVLGGCNAANLLDGLDGLLSGVVGIVALGLLVICLMMAIEENHDATRARELEAIVQAEVNAYRAETKTTPSDLEALFDRPGYLDEFDSVPTGPPGFDLLYDPGPGEVRIERRTLTGARIVLCIALFGAVLGFLPHNFNPATIFLGDCGSLLLGYMCAVIILMLGDLGHTHLVFAGLIIFSVPMMDTALAIVRRRLARQPMSVPDDQHIHHMLKQALGGVKRAVFALYGIGILFAMLGVTLAALWMHGIVRLRVIYAITIVLFSFIGVIAMKAARNQQLRTSMVRLQNGRSIASGATKPAPGRGRPDRPAAQDQPGGEPTNSSPAS
jgi:UDP-GlcNAc:undecaprenyl-phosphate GlcNAc-1-phosphate transferase